MEEAPKGSFEDELEWCIHQLETGLLRLNPTAQQVSDTQRILKVLRSRKAPFVKKRHMMNQVFGNYRQKMADERKAQERAAVKPPETHVQEATVRDSHSVAYRKCSRDPTGSSGQWFTGLNSNACSDKVVETGGSGDGSVGQQDSSSGEGFTFNFKISQEEECSSQSSEVKEQVLVVETFVEHDNVGHVTEEGKGGVAESTGTLLSHGDTNITNNTVVDVTANKSVGPEVPGSKPGDSPKKKKKKKSQGKNSVGTVPTVSKEKAVEAGKSATHQEEQQTGIDELKRELDWCVEQLELGLQRQKSTPKQVEEALRAIKTLRSEKAALVKKRQVMRAMFGDYRSKMEDERQKQLRLMQTAAKSSRVSEVAASVRRNSSKVFRPSIQNSHISSLSTQVSSTETADPGTSSQESFVFKSSNEPFCFNFF